MTMHIVMIAILEVIWSLDTEFKWWEARMVEVEKEGVKHQLAR